MEYLSGLGLESGWEDSNHRIAGPSSPLFKDLESFYPRNQPPLSKQPYVLLVDTSKASFKRKLLTSGNLSSVLWNYVTSPSLTPQS